MKFKKITQKIVFYLVQYFCVIFRDFSRIYTYRVIFDFFRVTTILSHSHLPYNATIYRLCTLCPVCGNILDRDVNAAINIREEALRILSEYVQHEKTEKLPDSYHYQTA